MKKNIAPPRITNGTAESTLRDIELTAQQASMIVQHWNEVTLAQQKLNAAVGIVLAGEGIAKAELVRLLNQTLTVRVLEE